MSSGGTNPRTTRNPFSRYVRYSSTDTASGVNHYEYRVSTNGGTTWGATVSAGSVTLSAAGSYVVQFRAVDNVGLASAWAPTVNGAANSACLT